MSEAKKEYLEVKATFSSSFMSVFGMAVENALLKLPAEWGSSGDSETDFIWKMLIQAMKKNGPCSMYSQEEGSELVRVTYDVTYTEEGEQAPEFTAYWRREKTIKDKEREERERRQDLRQIQSLAEKHKVSIHVFDTPETYGRFGTVQHTAVSGPPKQTGTYLIWIKNTNEEKEYPVSFYYSANENKWYEYADNVMLDEIDTPKFTAYMGPIPVKVV